jgi:polysaccharide pyruvyl transferase WcaK-like protein
MKDKLTALIVADLKNDNLGDLLIFNALSKRLLNENYSKVLKLSNKSYQSESVELVKVTQPLSFLLAFFRADKVYIGGGGIFQDDTSISNIIYFFLNCLLAKLLFKKVEVISVGVTSLYYRVSRILVKMICLMANEVSVRDESSREIISKYSSKKVNVLPDLALSYKPDYNNISKEIYELCESEYMLLVVRPLVGENKSNSQLYRSLVKHLKQYVVKKRKIYLPVFHEQKDLGFIQSLVDDVGENAALIRTFSIDDYCYLAKNSSVNICMRLHGSILCYVTGVDFLALAYNSKVRHFMESIKKADKCFDLPDIEHMFDKVN